MRQGREEVEGFTHRSNVTSKGRTLRMRRLGCRRSLAWMRWGSCEVQVEGEDHRVAPSSALQSPIPAAMIILTIHMTLDGAPNTLLLIVHSYL